MRTQTAQVIINLFNSSSKDETRINLNGVNVESLGYGKFKLTSTNGFILSQACIEDDSINMVDQTSSIIMNTKYNIIQLKQYIKNKKCFDSKWTENKVIVGEIISLSAIHAEFPRVSKILPIKEGKIKIAFNVDLLVNLTKVLGKRKKNIVQLCFDVDKNFDVNKNFEAKLKPITIIATKEDLKIASIDKLVLMPCKFKNYND